jgi:hypothetical protein
MWNVCQRKLLPTTVKEEIGIGIIKGESKRILFQIGRRNLRYSISTSSFTRNKKQKPAPVYILLSETGFVVAGRVRVDLWSNQPTFPQSIKLHAKQSQNQDDDRIRGLKKFMIRSLSLFESKRFLGAWAAEQLQC